MSHFKTICFGCKIQVLEAPPSSPENPREWHRDVPMHRGEQGRRPRVAAGGRSGQHCPGSCPAGFCCREGDIPALCPRVRGAVMWVSHVWWRKCLVKDKVYLCQTESHHSTTQLTVNSNSASSALSSGLGKALTETASPLAQSPKAGRGACPRSALCVGFAGGPDKTHRWHFHSLHQPPQIVNLCHII